VHAALISEALPRVEDVADAGQATAIMADVADGLAALLSGPPPAGGPGTPALRAHVLQALGAALRGDLAGDWEVGAMPSPPCGRGFPPRSAERSPRGYGRWCPRQRRPSGPREVR